MSLVPRNRAALANPKMTALMQKPEQREAMYRVARQKIADARIILVTGGNLSIQELRFFDAILSAFPLNICGNFVPLLGGSPDTITSRLNELEKLVTENERRPTSTIQPEAPPAKPVVAMNDARKKVLVAGLLVLCLLKLIWPDTDRYRWQWGNGMSLSTLVALCGAWACAVWLWSPEIRVQFQGWQERRKERGRKRLIRRADYCFKMAKFSDQDINLISQCEGWRQLSDRAIESLIDRSGGWVASLHSEQNKMNDFLKLNGISHAELDRRVRLVHPELNGWLDLSFPTLQQLRPALLKAEAERRGNPTP